MAALNAGLPPFWSHANPIDILGDATAERYRVAVEACVKDPAVQGVLILLTPQAMTDPTETARELVRVRQDRGQAAAGLLDGRIGGARRARSCSAQAGIPTFDSPEAAIRAFLHMVQYRRNQELLYERPEAMPEDWQPDMDAGAQDHSPGAAPRSERCSTRPRRRRFWRPTACRWCRAWPCRTMDEAVQAADQVGFPVVVKLLSTTVTHKSDVGGVMLNLADEAAVCAAFDAIRANVTRRRVGGRLRGRDGAADDQGQGL